MGHFGFSYIGLLYLLMLFIPNIMWAKHKPAGYEQAAVQENKILLLCERIGQVLVTCGVLIFSDYNLRPLSRWSFWLAGSVILMLLYETAWIRYFRQPTYQTFYNRFLYIPVPLASLPVCGFLLLVVYAKVWWMLVPVILLGIGHIGIHYRHQKATFSQTKSI